MRRSKGPFTPDRRGKDRLAGDAESCDSEGGGGGARGRPAAGRRPLDGAPPPSSSPAVGKGRGGGEEEAKAVGRGSRNPSGSEERLATVEAEIEATDGEIFAALRQMAEKKRRRGANVEEEDNEPVSKKTRITWKFH